MLTLRGLGGERASNEAIFLRLLMSTALDVVAAQVPLLSKMVDAEVAAALFADDVHYFEYQIV